MSKLPKSLRTALKRVVLIAASGAGVSLQAQTPSPFAPPPLVRTPVAPGHPGMHLVRLPTAPGWSEEYLSQAEPEVLTFAAGGITLVVPNGWKVRDVPVGFEIRHVFSPTFSPAALVGPQGMPIDGLWMSYHCRPGDTAPTVSELNEFLTSRLQGIAGQVSSETVPQQVVVQDCVALRYQFTTTVSPPHRVPTQRFHLVIGTTHGICEFHGSAPLNIKSRRWQEFEQMLASVKLDRPLDDVPATKEQTLDAEPILGTWKAVRGRMKFFGDGRVMILHDDGLQRLPSAVGAAEVAGPHRNVGHFVAQENQLIVDWENGQRQYFRWRRDGVDLYLTDHTGQPSLLRRIYE